MVIEKAGKTVVIVVSDEELHSMVGLLKTLCELSYLPDRSQREVDVAKVRWDADKALLVARSPPGVSQEATAASALKQIAGGST